MNPWLIGYCGTRIAGRREVKHEIGRRRISPPPLIPAWTATRRSRTTPSALTDSWHVGQKGKDNGAVLFAFMQEHRLRIAVNYGLEGVLPDALCKRII